MHLVNITRINTIKKFSVIKITGKPTQMEITHAKLIALAIATKISIQNIMIDCLFHLRCKQILAFKIQEALKNPLKVQ